MGAWIIDCGWIFDETGDTLLYAICQVRDCSRMLAGVVRVICAMSLLVGGMPEHVCCTSVTSWRVSHYILGSGAVRHTCIETAGLELELAACSVCQCACKRMLHQLQIDTYHCNTKDALLHTSCAMHTAVARRYVAQADM